MGQVTPEAAFRRLVARFEQEEAAARARAERLVAAVRELVPPLAAAAGAGEVRLFGSLVTDPEWAEPHDRSDIDLAIAGLDAPAFARLAGDLFAALPVVADIVRLEAAAPALRQRIMAHGLVVYSSGAEVAE